MSGEAELDINEDSHGHVPVLLHEVLAGLLGSGLDRALDGCYVDATFGRGGHARALLARLADDARLLVMDRDPQAIAAAQQLKQTDRRVTVAHGRFADLAEVLAEHGLQQVAGVLMDLGVSSPQLDDAGRGFSFQQQGPLDMRMDPDQETSAASWLNHADEKEIADVIYQLGEERFSRRIARQIVQRRPLHTTTDLVDAVLKAVPKTARADKHPATRTFQAVRMHVNSELEQLSSGLDGAFNALQPGGRLAVISFHSLEDRTVKQAFRKWSRPAPLPRRLPIRAGHEQMPGREIGRAVRPGAEELAANPRARSATLRVIEKRQVSA